MEENNQTQKKTTFPTPTKIKSYGGMLDDVTMVTV